MFFKMLEQLLLYTINNPKINYPFLQKEKILQSLSTSATVLNGLQTKTTWVAELAISFLGTSLVSELFDVLLLQSSSYKDYKYE